MPVYKAVLPTTLPGLTLKNGTNTLFVFAADATDAATIIQGHQPATEDQLWANATISEVVAADDLSPVVNTDDTRQTNSYIFTLSIAGDDTNASFTYTAASGEDLDDVMAAMVILLNLHADITGAAWATPNLTLSDIGDDIGDHTVTSVVSYGGTTIAGMDGATTHEGIAGAALLQAYSTIAPSVLHLMSA